MSRPLLPGYRMRRILHRGRSFDVHDAWSLERDCPVVVKVVRPGAAPEAARRLLREGRLLAAMSHPHLVRAYEVRRSPRAAVVLETLPGRTLGHLFERSGPLPARDVAQMGRQIASVLSYLHGTGMVHCDLKPANAVVEAGRVTVIDLSLAQRPGPYRTHAGTPGYLSPEQAGRCSVSPATDVWGLGLLMLEAAAGDDPFPFGCDQYDEDLGPRAAPPPLRRRRRTPRPLANLIDACCAFAPAERPALPDVASVLDAYLARG